MDTPSKFKFEKWAKQLPSAVTETLVENGFDSYVALVNATTASVTELKLKPGHHVATLAVLRELQGSDGPLSREYAAASTPTPAEAATTTTLDDVFGGGPGPATTTTTTTLDELLRMSTPGTSTASLGVGRVDLDPTVFLRTRSGEALQITDFIAFREAEQQEIELKEGVFIRLASGKPKLDTVSPAQFLAANSRIMAKLIETGRLSGQGIIDYLAARWRVATPGLRCWPTITSTGSAKQRTG
jgi:hypothetical protein